ncbi:uncharacterized protein LOC143277391 isoform X2 [Babylonia areolata]|uniref:uncharacterized protein LOC143277391 isoform X2 n=1 Tax=Babylonia areolata TaxID=304850 RepID=UPI003FD3BF65
MPALLDRPKMTRSMYEALKRHIMNERAKIKQEQEQDAMIERMRKEREQRKKKEAEEALTLEQTKEQISQLEKRLDQLRSNKHQLFLQLKKVLHQEEETRRRAQLKEQSEMLSLQQQAFSQHGLGPSGHPVMLQASHLSNRPTLYKPVSMPVTHTQAPMKRARSPSPPPSSSYQSSYHSDSKYAYTAGKPGPSSHLYGQHASASDYKLGSYPQSQSGQSVYASQSAHSFVPQQQQQPAVTAFQTSQAAGSKYSGGQSAFSSYPAHFGAHQTSKAEGFAPSYGLQRMSQPGFHGPQHGGSLQHPLDQAQKSAFPDDKYKQGSIVTGMPGQASSNYQPSAPTSTYQNQAGSSGRPSYPSQSHRQYYQTH